MIVSLERAARAAARAKRDAEAAERRRVHDHLKNQRETLRLQQALDRVQRERFYASRQDEARALTSDVTKQIESLQAILESRAHHTTRSVLDALRIQDKAPELNVPAALQTPQPRPEREAFMRRVRPLAWWEKLVGYRSRYNRDFKSADLWFSGAYGKWQEDETSRLAAIETCRRSHLMELSAYEQRVSDRNSEIEQFRNEYFAGTSDGVIAFFEIVLSRSSWPDGFPLAFRLAYETGPKQLVLDYELPDVAIVPTVAEYRYVKTKDAIEEKRRRPADIKEVYRGVVAATALRCIHECFTADDANCVEVLTFSGFVNTTNPATGNPIRPYLISVRVTRKAFDNLMLDRVETKACLRNLGAQVSPQPAELVAVKPIIEFDMVDKRFVEERDVLSELDSRPNLMDLTPAAFEALVANLFTRMGLETKLTRTLGGHLKTGQ